MDVDFGGVEYGLEVKRVLEGSLKCSWRIMFSSWEYMGY